MVLKGALVSCSNYPSDDKMLLQQYVEKLNGQFVHHLTHNVTHLIAPTYRSEKCQVAARLSIPVVSPYWLKECTARCNEPAFNAFQAAKAFTIQPFTGMKVSTTGFPKETRDQVQEWIVGNGGEYLKDMDKECTHLVAFDSSGEKYEAATRWGISIVDLDWIKDSVAMKALMNEDFYRLTGKAEHGYFAHCHFYFSGLYDKELPLQLMKHIEQEGGSIVVDLSNVAHYIISDSGLTPEENSLLKKRKIPILKSEWIQKCVESKRFVPWIGFESRDSAPKPVKIRKKNTIDLDTLIDGLLEDDNSNLIFKGLKFQTQLFTPEQVVILQQEITNRGGLIVETGADYVVAPFNSNYQSNLPLVTEHWLEACIGSETLLANDSHPIYRPWSLDPILEPTQVFGITGFDGFEREHVKILIERMGGRVTENFSSQNTHLLVNFATDSAKYRKAVEWNKIIVDKEWLFDKVAENQPNKPLQGVFVCLSSSLSVKRLEFAPKLTSLGAVLMTSMDNRCTHLIMQSTKPSIKEQKQVQKANQINCFIVSPWWIHDCFARRERLNELEYPVDYNPQKTLQVTAPSIQFKATETPAPKRKISSTCNTDDSQKKRNFQKEFGLKVDQLLSKSKNSKKVPVPLSPMNDLNVPAVQFNASTNSMQDMIVYEDPIALQQQSRLMSMSFESCTTQGSTEMNSSPDKENLKTFLITGVVDVNERAVLKSKIARLGGRVLDSSSFNEHCTHLIVAKINRTEKSLAACASGKWMLQPKYVYDSATCGEWLPEDDYEWSTHDSSKKWRLKLQGSGKKGAFDGWNVCLVMEANKCSCFKRVLEAGGAKVSTEPSFKSEFTHFFVEGEQERKLILANRNFIKAPILRANYITDYLYKDSALSIEKYTV